MGPQLDLPYALTLQAERQKGANKDAGRQRDSVSKLLYNRFIEIVVAADRHATAVFTSILPNNTRAVFPVCNWGNWCQ